jgi:hypothetical protein
VRCFSVWINPTNFRGYSESIRYLDVHPVLPDHTPPELKQSYKALLAPLLLNSALAAVRIQPPRSDNANIALKSTTRALENLDLSTSDQGTPYGFISNPRIHTDDTLITQPKHSTAAPSLI